jgi:hypothetical protein
MLREEDKPKGSSLINIWRRGGSKPSPQRLSFFYKSLGSQFSSLRPHFILMILSYIFSISISISNPHPFPFSLAQKLLGPPTILVQILGWGSLVECKHSKPQP